MLRFYADLGFDVGEVQPPLFYSVVFGEQKINFHGPKAWRSSTFTLRGPKAEPGCGDFCFVWHGQREYAEDAARLRQLGIVPPAERRDPGAANGRPR